MKYRRAVSTATALMLLVTTGCSSHSAVDAPQNPKAVIQIWIRQQPASPSAQTAARLAKAFTTKTGIKTKVVALYEDFETKMQQQAAQRQLPDIVINDTAQVGSMQVQGWAQEVDRQSFNGGDRISDQAWQAAQVSDGRYFGVPFSIQSFALFVRKDWRLKLHLPEPKTWDDLAKMADAFTRKDPDGDGKADTYGFVIPGTTTRGYMAWYLSSYIWANGGDFLTRVGDLWKPAINNDKSVAAVTWMKSQFCTQKVVNPDAVTIDTTRAHDTFEKGIGGIYLTGPYMLPRFVKSMGNDKLEVFPLPAGPDGTIQHVLAEGENIYLMSGSHNRAGQMKFAEFATSEEGQTIGMDGDDAGPIVRLPINQDVDLTAVRSDPRWQTFQSIFDSAGTYMPAVPSWTPFRQDAADSLNAIMANCQSNVKQELDKLASQFASELKHQNALAS